MDLNRVVRSGCELGWFWSFFCRARRVGKSLQQPLEQVGRLLPEETLGGRSAIGPLNEVVVQDCQRLQLPRAQGMATVVVQRQLTIPPFHTRTGTHKPTHRLRAHPFDPLLQFLLQAVQHPSCGPRLRHTTQPPTTQPLLVLGRAASLPLPCPIQTRQQLLVDRPLCSCASIPRTPPADARCARTTPDWPADAAAHAWPWRSSAAPPPTPSA